MFTYIQNSPIIMVERIFISISALTKLWQDKNVYFYHPPVMLQFQED